MVYRSGLETPIGWLVIEGTKDYLTEISFLNLFTEQKPNALTELAVSQFTAYFAGKRNHFNLPVKPDGTPFQKAVWQLVAKIPFGQTITYLDLANRYGDANAIRAVAAANGKNPLAILIPCHRVIGAKGALTGYAWGLEKKEWLLQHEGAIQPKLF